MKRVAQMSLLGFAAVIAVREGKGREIHMAPDGSYVVQASDIPILLGRNEAVSRLKELNGA